MALDLNNPGGSNPPALPGNPQSVPNQVTVVEAPESAFISFGVTVNAANQQIGSDVILNPVGERINSAMWASGDTTLEAGEFWTSSAQAATSGEYYLDIFRANPDADSTQLSQFSVAYGNYNGYGETGLEGQSDKMTPTKAIYSQYAALLEDKNTSTDSDFKFELGGSAKDSIYVINIGRSQLKERADSGNWELKLGSNKLSLVDMYVGSGSNDLGDGPIDIVSGSIASGSYTGPVIYGKFYPNYGVMVLDAAKTATAVTGLTEYVNTQSYDGATADYDSVQVMGKENPDRFFNQVKTGSYFKARSTEHLHSRTYFCRIPSYAANFSSNPTYVDTLKNDGSFLHQSMVGNPKAYITTVGLYDASNELVAVAKLSKPLLKSFNREALVRVRLEY
jgi:hypothetical protein